METTKEAMILLARQQITWMTPENQTRFEHVIALVEEEQMAPEDLATMVKNHGWRNKDSRNARRKLLRSGGGRGTPSATSSMGAVNQKYAEPATFMF